MGWLAIRVQAFEESPHATATLFTGLMPLFSQSESAEAMGSSRTETGLFDRVASGILLDFGHGMHETQLSGR